MGVMTRVSAEVLDGLQEGDEVVISGGNHSTAANTQQRPPRMRF